MATKGGEPVKNLVQLIHAATAAVGAAVALDAAIRRRRRAAEPVDAIILCEACKRAPAKVQCRAHKTVVCVRCTCPVCKEIQERIKAGKPRVPTAQPAHDPQTCKCPWCVKFDGPNANNPNVGMRGYNAAP